jgi:hypothetical protein
MRFTAKNTVVEVGMTIQLGRDHGCAGIQKVYVGETVLRKGLMRYAITPDSA